MDAVKRIRDMVGAVAWAREFSARDRWSRRRLLSHQRQEFSRLVRHAARRAPFYARLYDGIDLSGDLDPASLPAVDKRSLMDAFDDAVTDRRLTFDGVRRHLASIKGDAYHLGEYRVVATSGTSGHRGYFVYDRPAWRIVLANTLRWNRLMGIRPRVPVRPRVASIGADAPMHVTERIPQSGDVGLFKVQHFEATESVADLARGLQAFGPDAILAYPSIAALIADEQNAGRLSISPSVVSTHSEVLTDDMRARIRHAWGIVPFNHYGLTEEPHVAADCPAHEGLHVFDDTCLVEVVDENNRAVPAGTPGAKWLLTNLYNRAQPLIRYEVDDILTLSETPCPCGRPFALIKTIGGRSDEVLRLPALEGDSFVPVQPLALEMAIEAVADVSEYAVRCREDEIRLTVAPRTGADGAAMREPLARALEAAVRRAGGRPPAIRVEVVERLERRRDKMGKHRLVTVEKGPA